MARPVALGGILGVLVATGCLGLQWLTGQLSNETRLALHCKKFLKFL
jgi:hypothetical protein